MPRSSSPYSWQTLLTVYAAALLTILGISAIGISVTPSKGKSDAAFYGILFVAVIAAVVVWKLAEEALRKSASVAIGLPFMVQTGISPVWAVAAGATIMFSAKSPVAGQASAANTVIAQQIAFS